MSYKDNTVIVLDNSNYKSDYAEGVPFKASVVECFGDAIIVKSAVTNKEYELYSNQILETMDIDTISSLLRMENYGS